jgi:hypothetical protein
MRPTALQQRALEALGFDLWVRRVPASAGEPVPLADLDLPPGLRARLERWVGAQWRGWPAPGGAPRDAAFKRALWRRVRDWRRGG